MRMCIQTKTENVRGAMNCATTNGCFDNDKVSFGNGIRISFYPNLRV